LKFKPKVIYLRLIQIFFWVVSMKSLISVILIVFSGSILLAGQAQKDIVCEANENRVETTLLLNEKNGVLKIYRSFYGHTAPPEVVSVKSLPGTRGPVLAYGDSNQLKVLSINLLQRNSIGLAQATYLDILIHKSPIRLDCEL
jgi:hypothetical protein